MLNTNELNDKVKQIKLRTFDMVMNAGRGHLGGSFSSVEALVALYYGDILKFDPHNPEWEERDRLVLSKGHANNCLCVILSDLGFFEEKELNLYCQNGGILGGHSDDVVPGVEVVTGSLGHGLGLAAGMALGLKIDGNNSRVFCIIGDGESQEGSIWEAAMFAAHHRLDNLTVVLDRNNLGSEKFTKDTSKLEPLADKWRSFGWSVCEMDGHDVTACMLNLSSKFQGDAAPGMIISNTIKGNGIPSLQNTPKSHHTLPKDVEAVRTNLS